MSIVDLPTELVLEVGQFVVLIDPHHCLLSFLSQTCRRFQEIFAPCITAHHARSISESSIPTKFIGPEGGESKHPSTISLDGDFKKISFKLPRDVTLNDLRCFRTLITQANTISCIHVDVGNQDVDLRVLACFLNTCVQRPDLDLKVLKSNYISWPPEGGPFVFEFNTSASTPTDQRVKPVTKTSWPNTLRGALNRLTLHWKPKTLEEPKSLPTQRTSTPHNKMEVVHRESRFKLLQPRAVPRLTRFRMEGDSLLTATSYPWTRDMINAAPLKYLSINQSKLTLFDWSQILSSITIPTLTDLAIGRVNVTFPDLLLFFSRHPSLRLINLYENELIGVVSFQIPGTPSVKAELLPNLNLLAAPPEYIYPFMCRHHQDGYFQRLDICCLTAFPAGYNEGIRDHHFHPIFELIASHAASHLAITLVKMSLNSFLTWSLDTSIHTTSDDIRKLPGIRTLYLIYDSHTFRKRSRWLDDSVLKLLTERRKETRSLFYIDLSLQVEKTLLEHLFHIVCPDLRWITFIPPAESH